MVYGSDQITLIYMLTDFSEMSIFLGTASLCKAVPILCYFVIFISLPSNSIL